MSHSVVYYIFSVYIDNLRFVLIIVFISVFLRRIVRGFSSDTGINDALQSL